MATKIIHKKSSTPSSVPAAGDIEPGELALNLADQKIYSKTTGGTVVEMGGGTPSAADLLTSIKTVDGSGSGLDADLLDGQHGSYYAQKAYWPDVDTNIGDTSNPLVTFSSVSDYSKPAGYRAMLRNTSAGLPSNHGQNYFGYNVTSKRDWNGGYSALLTGYDGNQLWFTYTGTSSTTPTWRKVWHDGNDGSGSGLDADLLDGIDSGSFVRNDNGAQSIAGNLTVGLGTASYIHMVDSDHGNRSIHCNSNRIGFLKQDNSWGAYCDDSGNWVAVGNVTAYSDERLKSDIVTIPEALDKVKQLRGVNFTKDGVASTGVIAQEVQKVIPEVVVEGEEYLSVAYGNMVGLLIEAIKEQQTQIDELKAKLEEA